MKKLITLLLILSILTSFAACGDMDDEEHIPTVRNGKLTVAFSPDFAPMEFVDLTKEGQDRYVGFDVTLAKFIAEHMNLELVLVPMSFDACLQALSEGTVDLSVSGYSWTQEREDNFNLSDYYHTGRDEGEQVLITLAGNTGMYCDSADLAGARVGVQNASLQEDLTREQLPDCRINRFVNLDDGVQLLLEGKLDCIAVADENADAIIAANPEIIKSGYRFVVTEKQVGNIILLPKGNDEMTALVNNILKKAEMYYETWYADARSTAGIETSYDDEGNLITE